MSCMINYIICEDNVVFRKQVLEIIDRIMMQNDIVYEKHEFDNYGTEFIELMNKKCPFKIYILDIEVNGQSGIDIASRIRKDDIDSMLIFYTAHYKKYEKEMLKNKFLFLAFIDKERNYKEDLEEALTFAIKHLSMKNIIRFKSQKITHTIATMDVLYIMRNKDRKCTIQLTNDAIIVSKSLVELEKMLDNRFVYCHRACIVNYDRIVRFNQKNKTILFDNNMGIDLVSSRFRM